jgi:hypothetical protein
MSNVECAILLGNTETLTSGNNPMNYFQFISSSAYLSITAQASALLQGQMLKGSDTVYLTELRNKNIKPGVLWSVHHQL